MEQGRQGNLWAALSLSLILAAAAIWVAEVTGASLFGASDAEVIAKIESEAADRKAARPEDVLPLTHPVGYAASMNSCAAGKCAPTQYVYPK